MEAKEKNSVLDADVCAVTTAPPVPDAVSALQRDVQRKLGHCMLRLQQYEKMIKALAANFELAGPANELQDIRKKREAALANQTLGGLVTVLSGSYLSLQPASEAQGSETSEPEWEPPDTKQICIRMDARIPLSPEEHQRVVSALRDLVALRNRLVHHFIEDFDIWSTHGCLAADAFLEESYAQIDMRCMEARSWLVALDEGRKAMAAFMSTETWSDLIIHGIQPDGTVEWRQSSMVEHLRETETALAVDGWAPLDGAMDRMKTRHPEYTLERYKRSSWRQVLNDCGHFDQRCVDGAGSKDSRTWFRSRKRATT